MKNLVLVAIGREGVPAGDCLALDGVARDACEATAGLYARRGFVPPWVGYLAVSGETVAGTCAFTAPPAAGEVELAYFTFPRFEGRGLATAMASRLVTLARAVDPGITLVAHTLPERNASTRILEKLGFALRGPFAHPEDGEIWVWELPPSAATPPPAEIPLPTL